MRKALYFFAAAALGLGLLCVSATRAQAQDVDENGIPRVMLQNLPNDPAVRVGQLDNGLTYYIRQNGLPEKRAEFYLATNVGGIQETPDQDGLAHFLEHMCFNGTEHFPGKGILDYLRSIGAEFGRNINASTGFEETQYMLNNIPVERETVVDTCLMILADYSHYVTNATEEIDAERGVILEERRARRNAQWRLLERSLPYWFGDCKYATCTLIGSQENLETFKPESLHNFYKTWYYPGNQAVIVVGDIDPDRVEQKIKDIFGPIPANENPQAKEVITVPSHAEPVVGVLTDPEETSATISLMWMGEATPEEYNPTLLAQTQRAIKMLISTIMAERFEDITSDPNSPYQGGSFGIESMIYENTEAVMADVTLKEDNILEGFRAFYTEIERMVRFGFTDDEVERAKTKLLSWSENAVKRAPTRKNAELVRPLLSNFFDKTPYMTPEDAYETTKQVLEPFNAMILSMLAQQLIPEENLVILYTGPEKAGIQTPTEAQLLAVMAEVKASDISAGENVQIAEQFLDPDTLPGSKVSAERQIIYGATEWTLENGIKVTVLPTKYAEDQILFDIFEEGGKSLISDADMPSFDQTVVTLFQNNSGVGPFSGTEVSKMLAGKSLRVNPYLDDQTNGVAGQSTVKDLETAFQILYLVYADPRFDQKEWDNGISQLSSVLPNLVNTPNYVFAQRYFKALYNDSPRHQQISPERLAAADFKVFEKNYRRLFSEATGANMVIVGDVDLAALKPLVEKYIGSIKTGRVPAVAKHLPEDMIASGKIVDDFKTDMTTPQATVAHMYSVTVPFDARTEAALDIVQYILDMRYVTSLREEEGGTYGASTATAMLRDLETQAICQTMFNCNPAMADKLRELTVKGITDLANEGPTDDEMKQAVLNLKKNLPESRISNQYWKNNLIEWIRHADDTDTFRETAITLVTKEDVIAITKKLIESGNFIEVVQRPTKEVEE